VNSSDLLHFGVSTIGASGGFLLDPEIHPIWNGAAVCGPAFTVTAGVADNLAVQVAVAEAPAGSVIVVRATEPRERGYWGELLTTQAIARGILGVVLDGDCRDVDALASLAFPIFATGVSARAANRSEGGSVGGRVMVGGVEIASGDIIVGDSDGVVVVKEQDIEIVIRDSSARSNAEAQWLEELEDGATTIEILGLDPSSVERRDDEQ
jgi:4-hydroxy-4-methyl-2-oxoglutarate aldolase